MAVSSSSSSSAPKQYDVFISLRGEDTRNNFTSHLSSALSRNSIKTYVDYELKKGDEISLSLIDKIHDSYGSLVVFSENYASSKWCLNGLLEILKCRKQGHFVIPVFYNIDPSHVRKQTGSYEQAFAKHEHDSKNGSKLQLWKTALTEAANIVGWDSQSRTNRDESELIQNIVNDILQKMDHIYQLGESSFVGIEKYCEDIELLLQRSLLVGIWGIGGVGKTTIAKVVFDKLFSQYDSYYFFENVRDEWERNGLNYIRDKLLSELLKDENFHSSTPNTPAFKFAMRRLSGRKVLIVLDDVNRSEQLEHLQQLCKCLGADSKIVITTRDKSVLLSLRVDHEIYEVQGLNFKESLQLFRLNAFNKKYPEIGYEEMTIKVVDYAKGNPLALKVLGSFLISKSKEEWKSALAKLKKIPKDNIQKVLRLSYDGLDDKDQQLFLDIACFLRGEHIKNVIDLSNSYGFFGHIGMKNLRDKALVTISYDHRVDMHDLLQEMGWDIVRRESIKCPEERSRLWDPEEVCNVLKNNKGTHAVEGIILNMSQIQDLSLKADTFKKMTKLRFLKFYSSDHRRRRNVHLPEGIELCSNTLGYFYWHQFPFHSLPSNFCAEKLVVLRMPNSHITKLWDGLQDVVNLKEIELRGCKQLVELPDLSNASKLERVHLSWCENLSHIPPSLLHQDTLAELNIDYCGKLASLQSQRPLKSLKDLSFAHCSSLKEFSLSSEKIELLIFVGTIIDMVPSSIGCCKNLKLVAFEDTPKKVSSEMPKSTSVKDFDIINGSGLDTSELQVIFHAFPCLEHLRLMYCDKLFQLPDNISILSSLNELILEHSSVESLPTSIKYLPCLKHLDVSNCQRLRSLPELPLSIRSLWARNCSVLQTLVSSADLKHCDLEHSLKLDQQSLYSVTSAAHYRVRRAERTRVCLPGDRVPWWFCYRTTQDNMSIKLASSSRLMGFVFCLIVSQDIYDEIVQCQCYLEDSGTEEVISQWDGDDDDDDDMFFTSFRTGHVYLWNDRITSDSLNAMEGRASVQVSFRLFTDVSYYLRSVIKEFAVRPIYESGWN